MWAQTLADTYTDLVSNQNGGGSPGKTTKTSSLEGSAGATSNPSVKELYQGLNDRDRQREQQRDAEEQERLRRQMVEDATQISQTVDHAVQLLAHLPSADVTSILGRLTYWRDQQMLPDLIDRLRKIQLSNKWQEYIGGSTSCWRFLVSAMSERDQNRLHGILSKDNINAKNWGRLTDDLLEYWDVRMGADVSDVKSLWRKAEEGEGDEAAHRRKIITIIEKYVDLDEKFGMGGTLLSRFLNRMNINTTKKKLLLPDEASILLDDLKASVEGDDSVRLMGALNKSHLVLAKQPLPPEESIGDWLTERLSGFADKLDGLLSILVNATPALANRIWKHLCNVDKQLVIDFMVKFGESFAKLTRLAFSLLTGEWLVKLLMRLDYARIGKLLAAWLAAGVLIAYIPLFIGPYLLLPEKHQMKILEVLDEHVFKILITEARDLMAPLLRKLVQKRWPVNFGVSLDRAVGVAPGIAFARGEKYFHLIRTKPDSITYVERFEMRAGVGRGVGVGKNTGGKDSGKGDGSQKNAMRGEAMAHAQAGGLMNRYQESEFPLLSDDAFFSLLLTILELDVAAGAGALFLDSLATIDPLQYLKKTKIEMRAFAEAAGAAQAGLVDNSKDSIKDGKTHHWDDQKGRPDLGQANTWQRMFGTLSASVNAFVSIGGGVELEAVDGKEDEFDVILFGAAGAVSAANINVPILGALAPRLTQVDRDAGVRLKYRVAGIQAHAPRLVGGKPKLALFTSSGELDVHEGVASEVELQLDSDDPRVLTDLKKFRDSFAGLKVQKRIGIQIPAGRKLWRRIYNQKHLGVGLSHDNTLEKGGSMEGYIDLDLDLRGDDARRILDILVGSIKQATRGDVVERLQKDLEALISGGKLPKYITDLGEIVPILIHQIEKVMIHVEAGGRLGGRKEGFELTVGGQVLYQRDITDVVTTKLLELTNPQVLSTIAGGSKAQELLAELVADLAD